MRVLIALLLFQAIVSGQSADYHVGKIIIGGNRSFSRKELLSHMELQPPGFFSKTKFAQYKLKNDVQSLRTFYESEGFYSLVIGYETTRDTLRRKITIRFTIMEGRRALVRDLAITGAGEALDTHQIAMSFKSRRGEPLRYVRVQADAQSMREKLAAGGWLLAAVDPMIVVDSMASMASIDFRIETGPRIVVGPIRITGLSHVKQEVVLRELTFKAGDILTSDVVRKSELRIYNSRMFRFVKIRPEIDDSSRSVAVRDTVVPVVIQVSQTDYFTVESAVGYGAYERLSLSARVSYANLFHRGHTITSQGELSGIEQQTELSYLTHWFYRYPVDFAASVYYRRHDNLLFDIPLSYTGKFNGVEFAIGHAWWEHFAYELLLDWENVNDLKAPIEEELPENVPKKSTQSIVANLVYDRRNDKFSPTNGFSIQFKTQIAGLGGSGSNQFVKFTLENRIYRSLRKGRLIGTSLTLGFAMPYGVAEVVPIQDLFVAGGSRSIRGYERDHLITTNAADGSVIPKGGTVEVVSNIIDAQFPLFWIVQGALFLDGGYIWEKPSLVNLREFKFSAGPGIRLITPIGMVRLDTGFQLEHLRHYEFHFDIGRPF